MAVPTHRLAQDFTDAGLGSANRTSSSFTPSDNSLLVVAFTAIQYRGGPSDVSTDQWSVSGGGLTWTQRKRSAGAEAGGAGSGTYCWVTEIWTAPVTTGASMTVTIDHPSTVSPIEYLALACDISDVTGYDTGSPIGATAAGQDIGAGAASITLDAAPAAESVVLAALGAFQNEGTIFSAAPGSGWTELSDTPLSGTFQWGHLQAQYRGGSTSTSVAWADTIEGGTEFHTVAAAIEIKAAGGGAELDLVRVRDETQGLTGTMPRALARVRLRADTEGAGETKLTARARLLLRAETEGLTETRSALRARLQLLAEAIGLTETRLAALAAAIVHAIAETLGLSETRAALRTRIAAVSETLGLTEAALRLRAMTRRVSETAGVSEALDRARAMARSCAETLGLTDIVSRARALSRHRAETAGAVESSAWARGFARVVSEVVGLAEAARHAIGQLVESALAGLVVLRAALSGTAASKAAIDGTAETRAALDGTVEGP